MYSGQSSTPTRTNQNSILRNYGSSGFGTRRSSYNRDYSYASPTSSDANFADSDFNFDTVSESSNDILATIDGDLLCLEANNVSKLYNNAADALSNNTAFNFPGAPKEPTSHRPLTKTRLLFFLSPSIGIEFARTFSSLYMLVNLSAFFKDIHNLSLPVSGVLGIFAVQCIARRFRTLKSKTASPDNKRAAAVKYFLCYQIITMISLALLTGVSWAIVFSEISPKVANPDSNSSSTIALQGSEKTPKVKDPSIIFPAMLMIGYSLVTSGTGSGQFFLMSFTSHFDPNISSHRASSLIVLFSTVGGTLAGLFGILDTVSNWCPHRDCYDHVTAQSAILSSITLCVCSICLIASISAIYLDPILELLERIHVYLKTNFFLDPNLKESECESKNDKKTAQEDFDECAALLEASGRSHSSSHFTGHSVGSQNTLLDIDGGQSSAATTTANTNIKLYANQISKTGPTLKEVLKRKSFFSVALLVSFLSCLSVIFQYYAPTYLSDTIFEDLEMFNKSSRVTGPGHNNNTGDAVRDVSLNDSYTETERQDVNRSAGLKIACAGTFVCNLIFLIIYMKRKWMSLYMNSRYKPWTCPLLFMAMSVFAIALASTDEGFLYLITAFLFGAVKMVEAEMLHSVAKKADTTWPSLDDVITSSPQAFLWSLVPMSMLASSLMVTPFKMAPSSYPHIPMVYVTALCVILVFGFGIARVKIIG